MNASNITSGRKSFDGNVELILVDLVEAAIACNVCYVLLFVIAKIRKAHSLIITTTLFYESQILKLQVLKVLGDTMTMFDLYSYPS